MNFLSRVRDAVIRFMYGRNGVDQLTWAIIIAELALSLIGGLIPVAVVRRVINLVTTLLLVLAFFRIFSRNIYKRREENARFLQWWAPVRQSLLGARSRRADKAHKYVKCACGAYCRVPKGVGKVELTCPKCGAKKIVNT